MPASADLSLASVIEKELISKNVRDDFPGADEYIGEIVFFCRIGNSSNFLYDKSLSYTMLHWSIVTHA